MRIPRRNFVVEYKTNRRQTKVQSASIWGNVDLKAVARDLESESDLPKADARLFDFLEQPVVGEPEAPTLDVQPVARHPDNPIATPSPKDSDTEAATVAVPEAPRADAAPEQEPLVSALGPSSKSQARRRASTRIHKGEMPTRPATPDDHLDTRERTGSEEELFALEAENRHLKRLMEEKLRAENDLLRSMLLRFDAQ
ncbi:hypothetical protein PMI07_004802 [Rhizobium sp. CF080]|uniref:hypothetical protein n=1 Tax=Rhizobium sp. (strain CF080) TaxID=1144310 RepID=UPI000271D578|nr:hypothetical protein [Rhizobium sp. CF080]EUB98521.1 hypothetical protein PMI07_004802 [Rhizobium sp. CF080]